MPDEQRKEVDAEVAETPKDETPPEAKTYSEEQVKQIRDAQKQEKDNALADQYSKLNTRLSRLGEENARLRESPKSSRGMADALKSTIGVLESQVSEMGEVSPATRTKLAETKQHLANLEQQAAYERQEAITSGVKADLRKELDEAGIDPDSIQCDGIWDAIQIADMSDGNFDGAKGRATRVIKSAKSKEEKKAVKPEEEELSEDDPRVQKALLKAMEKNPAFKTHDGTPSGAGGGKLTVEQVRNMPPEERKARAKDIAEMPLGI